MLSIDIIQSNQEAAEHLQSLVDFLKTCKTELQLRTFVNDWHDDVKFLFYDENPTLANALNEEHLKLIQTWTPAVSVEQPVTTPHAVELLNEQIAQIEDAIQELLKQKNELVQQRDAVATKLEEPVIREEVKVLIEEEKTTMKKQKASRVKRSKTVDKTVEAVKGKRDVNKGDATKIDAAKSEAMQHKPLKVEQEKRSTAKPSAEKAKTKGKQPARKHEGMSYSELRSNVSQRKAALNKADQERMTKAGCRNNTWEGAIASYNWLNQYFPTRELVNA